MRPVTGLILSKQVKVEGFMVFRWLDQWPDAFKDIAQWILEVMAEHVLSVLSSFFHYNIIMKG